MAEGAVSYESVLAALEYITFPQNCNRLNVKKDNDRTECQSTTRPCPADSDRGAGCWFGADMESFCAGGVFSWAKRSSYGWGGGAAGDGGMIASSHTQGRPNLSRFLCRYAQKERPGFDFTSIQVVRRDTFVSCFPSR